MALENVFRMMQRYTSDGGDAIGAFVSTAAGIGVLSVLAWLYVPEFNQVKHLAECGTVVDGTVTSCDVKAKAAFKQSARYDLHVDGPTGRDRFDTGIQRKVGEKVHYVRSRTDHLIRELSPGTTQEQVFADLMLTRANALAAVLALAAFGYASRGAYYGIRAVVKPISNPTSRIQFQYGYDVLVMGCLFFLGVGLGLRAAFHVLEAGPIGLAAILLFGGPLASGAGCYLVWHVLRRRRSNEVRRVAESLGLTFQLAAEGGCEPSKGLRDMRGRIGKLRNIVRGVYGGVDIAIFDVRLGIRIVYSCVQTVICFPEGFASLPDFSTQGWHAKVPPEFRDALRGHELFAARSHCGRLTLYRPGRLVRPHSYQVLLHTAIEERAAFCKLSETADHMQADSLTQAGSNDNH